MRGSLRPFLAGLVALLIAAGAKAETVGVKDSTLSRARAALTRYDLGPEGTLSLLGPLARFSLEHKGSPQGDEAAFLRAAAAADLLFISDFAADTTLRTRLAESLGVPPEALAESIAGELRACAHGVYQMPAEAVLNASNPGSLELSPPGQPDTRRDALLLRRALQFETPAQAGAHFAALGRDPCEGAKSCAEPFAQLEVPGRRALGFMQELGTALQRLEQAGRLGDPLAAALAEPLATLHQQLLAARVRLPPRLPGEITTVGPEGAVSWPAPDLLLLVGEHEVRFSRLPLARITEAGGIELVAQAEPAFPNIQALVALRDLTSLTRPIDDLVAEIRKLRDANEPVGSVAVTTLGRIPAHVLGRVLISLDKAGVRQLALIGRAADGGSLGVALHVTFAGVGPPAPATDLKLRIRLGGYSLSLGSATIDIPRIKVEDGWRFDVERLHAATTQRAVKSAAVSFMGDVAAEQVVVALFQVRPGKNPVELVVQ